MRQYDSILFLWQYIKIQSKIRFPLIGFNLEDEYQLIKKKNNIYILLQLEYNRYCKIDWDHLIPHYLKIYKNSY